MPTRTKRAASQSSDDEAPEAVSFGSSKKAAQGEREAVQRFHASEKEKRKEKNRAFDRALKERSTKGKAKAKNPAKSLPTTGKDASSGEEEDGGSDDDGGGDGPSRRDLEARMARAMMEADDEDDEEEGEGSAFGGFSGEDDVEMEGGEYEDEDGMSDAEEEFDEDDEEEEEASEDEDEEMQSGSDEDEDEDEDVDLTAIKPTSSKSNYLPDHLFKSALSGAASKSSKIVFDDTSRPSPPSSKQQKRKRRKQSSKDILLGSRTIRTLPKANAVTSSVVAKGLSRPRRVEKFTRDSLNLKGDALKSKTKGWTRKSANLGVLKRSGPAANFVRSA